MVPALALVGALAGCDQDLTEINENPNSPEVVPVGAVLSSGIWDLVSNLPGRGVFGEWTTLYHTNLWAQHLAQSAYNDEDGYTPREGINENIWSEMYSGPLTDLENVKEIAQASGDANLEAVAEILQVYGFLFLTDLYGDIPYEQALDLENYSSPEFSMQENIYPDLLARLDAAAGMIGGASGTWRTGDLVYGGDMTKWAEFANSLRLRIAMRTSETGYASTAAGIFADAWSSDRFDSNADNATLAWTGNLPSQNPIFEQIVLGGRSGDFRVSATLADMLIANDDPRLGIFLNPAVSDGEYRGLPNGNLPGEVGLSPNDLSTIGDVFVAADAPSVLMSYAETLFLGAEAADRGWIAGDAQALCESAIEASMLQYGVAASDIAAYLAANPCTNRTDILTEKWIALYLLGPESFADVRRTGTPDLPLPANAVIPQLPARMPYPAEEALFNPNFDPYKSVDYTVPLWWMP